MYRLLTKTKSRGTEEIPVLSPLFSEGSMAADARGECQNPAGMLLTSRYCDVMFLQITGYAALERAHEQGGVGQPGDVSLVAAAGRVGLTDLPGR
jgi:hypothetical protein